MAKIAGMIYRSMLVHASRGRLRFRLASLKNNPEAARLIEECLAGTPGILQVVPNTLTGTLLVLYDERSLAQPEHGVALLQALAQILPIIVTKDSVSFASPVAGASEPVLLDALQALEGCHGISKVRAGKSGRITLVMEPQQLNIIQIFRALIGSWKLNAVRQNDRQQNDQQNKVGSGRRNRGLRGNRKSRK
jgi:hypothetical protein